MKNNEIGHFPFEAPTNQFSKGGYPRQLLTYEGEGEAKHIKWLTNFKLLGEVPTIAIPENTPFGKLLVDLQTAFDCYCADELEYMGTKYVHLQGSGWADCGFPFFDDSFDPKDPYKTGRGCYALIKGTARNRFVKLAKQDFIPAFNDCSTGNISKDFSLPA